MTEFACDLSALTSEERTRHGEVFEEMRDQVEGVQALPAAYALRFPATHASLSLLAEFISRERLCCPFFTFALQVEANRGPVWLEIGGPEGVKEFLQAEMNLSTLVQ